MSTHYFQYFPLNPAAKKTILTAFFPVFPKVHHSNLKLDFIQKFNFNDKLMTERLLQFIWQFQYFKTGEVLCTNGQVIYIIFQGNYNTNQGPDFLNAKIRIGETVWAGSVELHINSEDWKLHNHSLDKNYNNVILHVVWNHNADFELPFPTLELKQLVSKILLKKYEVLMQQRQFIPCENFLQNIDQLIISTWTERLLIERLQQKALYVKFLLEKNNHQWEEVFWWMIAKNFGSPINSGNFEKMAMSIPLNVISRHKGQLLQLEALLMGQAGLLQQEFAEKYPVMLQKEFNFLKSKYKFAAVQHPIYFLRMRPANFPTIRLAQLAMLYSEQSQLFNLMKETSSLKEAEKLFDITANDYWHYHYIFDESSPFKKKSLGKDMVRNLFINTVIPMMYAFGYYTNNEVFKTKALLWIEQLTPEKNNITKGFVSLGFKNVTAFDSQALIQLKNEYCDQKKCLHCAIGNSILKKDNL